MKPKYEKDLYILKALEMWMSLLLIKVKLPKKELTNYVWFAKFPILLKFRKDISHILFVVEKGNTLSIQSEISKS